jgi:CheY-like chemotaxis protein
MKIFLLEDSVERLQRFRRAFHSDEITHSANADEAINMLAVERFDLICLDHDLTEHDTEWIAMGNGFEVAQYLGSNKTPNDDALIIVHTMNPEAGDRMMETLNCRRTRRVSIIELFTPAVVSSLK